MFYYFVYKGQNSLDDNLCKSDVQVDIYQKLLLIKSNPVVFLLIPWISWFVILNLWWGKYLLLFIHHHLFFERATIFKVYQMLCTIWYSFPFKKIVKNAHGGMSLLVKLQTYINRNNILLRVFFTFLKLYKWYQIVQRISLKIKRKW